MALRYCGHIGLVTLKGYVTSKLITHLVRLGSSHLAAPNVISLVQGTSPHFRWNRSGVSYIYLDANISKTVRDRGSVPKDHQ